MSRSLGSLTVDLIARVGGFQDGMSQAERAAQRSGRNISGSMRGASSEIDEMSRRADAAGATLRRFATIAGAAFAGVKLTQLVRDAADLNSRYEQLGGIMNVVGRNAGLSADQVNRYAKEVQAMGITMMESRQTVITMTQAQLDLSRASELARAAQDAAAVAGINSSEALQRIISGIQSNNVEVLRGVGLNVNFEQSYRDMEAQLGRTRGGLNEAEKAQARMNITLEAAAQIAGSYEASMDSASKQLGSTARYVEDLQVMWGAMFSEANRQLVFGYSDALKGLLDITEELYSDGSMEEWGRVVNHAMDAATALAVVLGARLAGSLATVAASKALATQQAIAYQLALARMSGLSAAAAGSQVALGAAVTTASSAMALVGGPVGFAVIAAAGIYTFREELGLVPYTADRASESLERLASGMEQLDRLDAIDRISETTESLAKLEKTSRRTESEIERLQERLAREPETDIFGRTNSTVIALRERIAQLTHEQQKNEREVQRHRTTLAQLNEVVRKANEGYMTQEEILRQLGGSYKDAGTGAGKASEEVKKIIERLEQEQRQLTMTSKELLRYNLLKENATPEEIKHALSLHDTNESLKENQRATDAARKAVEQMLEAEAKASVGRQTTMDATRRQVEVLGRQVSVVGQGRAAQEALNRALHIENQLRSESYRNLLPHQQEEYRRLIEQQYDLQRELERQAELAQVYEANWTRGIERVRDGFGDFFERMIVDGKASFSDLTDLFKKMIAEMIATAAANRIMIGLGFAGGSAAAAAGGLGSGSGAGGLSNLFSVAQMANTAKTIWSGVQGIAAGEGLSGFSGLGGQLTSGITLWADKVGMNLNQGLSSLGQGMGQLAWGLESTGYTIAEAVGIQGISAGNATLIGSAATAGAGWAGGYAGAGLGRDLFGKEGSGWGATGGAMLGAYVGSIIPGLGTVLGSALGGLVGGVVDSIFGSSAWNTTRGGLQLGFDESGEFDPMQWTRQTKKGGLFSSTRRRYRFHELDEELDAALRETYSAALDGVREMYGVLGVAVEDGVLEGVQIATLQIGTSGKSKQSQEQIEQQISQWFGDLQEAAVQAIDPSLSVETLSVYAGSLASVNEVFGAIGLSAYEVSVEGGRLSAQLLQLAGGIENLLNATDFYYQNFYSEQERLANLTGQTTAAFEAMGLVMPGNRAEFRLLVESIDQTTEAGQALFLQLLNLAPAMHDIAGASEAAYQELLGSAQDSLRSAWGALEASVRNEQQALTAAWNDTRNSIQGNIRTVQNAMRDTERVATSLNRTLEQMRGNSLAFDPSMQFAEASDYLRSVLASGGLGDKDRLDRALAVVANPSAGTYETLVDYQRDFLQTASVVEELEARAGKQLSAQERSVAALERQLALSETQYAEEMARLDGVLERQAQMIEAMLGQQDWLASINAGILSIPDAIAALGASIRNAQQVQRDASMTPTEQIVAQAYRDLLGREAREEGLAYWTADLVSGRLTTDQLIDTMRRAAIENGEIPRFSGGGIAMGPSSGYLAELHGKEAVVPIPNGHIPVRLQGGGEGMAELRAEVKALRSELQSANRALVKSSEKQRELLQRWDQMGLPEERSFA